MTAYVVVCRILLWSWMYVLYVHVYVYEIGGSLYSQTQSVGTFLDLLLTLLGIVFCCVVSSVFVVFTGTCHSFCVRCCLYFVPEDLVINFCRRYMSPAIAILIPVYTGFNSSGWYLRQSSGVRRGIRANYQCSLKYSNACFWLPRWYMSAQCI